MTMRPEYVRQAEKKACDSRLREWNPVAGVYEPESHFIGRDSRCIHCDRHVMTILNRRGW